MTWFSGSGSSYCHLLTVPLLTSKTFGFVWGINCYSNIVQACCRDQFESRFSFCLFTTQFDGGRDLPVVPEGMCVIHAGGFLKRLQWSQVIHGTKVHCWMLHFTQKQPSTGVCWKSLHYPGQTIAVFCGRASGSIPPAYCCHATMTLSRWEVDFSRQSGQQDIWLNLGRHLYWRSFVCFQG